MEELINEFEEMCGSLSISHDSPSEETIKEYFEKYYELKQLKLNVVSNSVLCPNCGCNKLDSHKDYYTCLNRECDFGGKLTECLTLVAIE